MAIIITFCEFLPGGRFPSVPMLNTLEQSLPMAFLIATESILNKSGTGKRLSFDDIQLFN